MGSQESSNVRVEITRDLLYKALVTTQIQALEVRWYYENGRMKRDYTGLADMLFRELVTNNPDAIRCYPINNNLDDEEDILRKHWEHLKKEHPEVYKKGIELGKIPKVEE